MFAVLNIFYCMPMNIQKFKMTALINDLSMYYKRTRSAVRLMRLRTCTFNFFFFFFLARIKTEDPFPPSARVRKMITLGYLLR